METKKFISGLGQTKEITAFLNANLVDYAIINLTRNADNTITFTSILDFHIVETHTLDTAGQRAFELFGQFRNSKNAIACLLKAIETKKPITDDTFKNQSKITPAKYETAEKALKTFGTFYAYLTDAQKAELSKISENWMKEAGFKDLMTDFYFINGENGLNLKEKQIIKIYDPVYGQHIYSMVFIASPNGIVTCIDDEAVFSLSAESAKTIELVDSKKAPAEVSEFFLEKFNQYTEECEERKTDKLEKAIKLDDQRKKALKIANERAEKAEVSKKALEAKNVISAKELKAFEKMKMTTKEEIEAVTKMIESKDEVLTRAHKRDLMEKVKKSKMALKTTPKASVTAEVSTPAQTPAPASVPSVSNARQRRGNAPDKPKAQPATIEEIIAEDAKSENPILA